MRLFGRLSVALLRRYRPERNRRLALTGLVVAYLDLADRWRRLALIHERAGEPAMAASARSIGLLHLEQGKAMIALFEGKAADAGAALAEAERILREAQP